MTKTAAVKPPRAKSPAATSKQKILIASGVNLDLLGRREAEHYGTATLAEMEALVRAAASDWDVALTFFQSNSETAYLEALGADWAGAVLNPGAWTHTSLALADRLLGLKLPFVEVHLSRVAAREEIRQTSLVAPHALGTISGFGIDSYRLGFLALASAVGL